MTGPARAPRPEDWVQRAENDLRNAQYTLTMGDDCPFDTTLSNVLRSTSKPC